MMANLQELPTALLETIVSYVGDPQTLCHFEAACKICLTVVQQSGQWDTLHRQRWTTSASSTTTTTTDQHSQSSAFLYTKSDYQWRHLIDRKTVRCMEILSTAEATERDELVKAVTEVMSFGRDCLDVCWKTWREHQTGVSGSNNDNHNNNNHANSAENKRMELVAMCLLRSVHCSAVFRDIQHLRPDDENRQAVRVEEMAPGEELEEFVITSSRMFFDLKEGPKDTTSEWIRQQLDDIANQVKARFPGDTSSVGVEAKLQHLNAVFFDELKFGGNTENYYDFENSLLHIALQRKTGIPMTLAVLYKCISRRIGLHVEIIGLPGHIVIGLPELDAYVDVFRKGRRLMTVEDCERIVNSYGHPLLPEYIRPLTPEQVFGRILNNFGNCLAQTFPRVTTKRMAVEAMRAVLMNPTNDQVENCVQWFSQIIWGVDSDAILRDLSMW